MRGGGVGPVGWVEETGPSSGEDSLAEGTAFVGRGDCVDLELRLLERERERRLDFVEVDSGSEGVAGGEKVGSSSIFGSSVLASLCSVSTSGCCSGSGPASGSGSGPGSSSGRSWDGRVSS